MFRLRALGGLGLEKDGVVLDGAAAQRRPLALLAILAIGGETGVSRDRLCSLLWPESDVERARGSLKQSLYSVRRDSGAADVVIGSTDLRLNPERITSDVKEFRGALASGDLEGAVSIYTGPLLDGLHLRDADEFERWSEEVRRELAAQYARALERLTQQSAERRDSANAVVWARKWSAAEPLSERAIIRFMTSLDAVGDRAGAVKQGELHRALLRAELGVEPGSSLIELLAQLRDPDTPAALVDEVAPATAVDSVTLTAKPVDDAAAYPDAVAPVAAVAIAAQQAPPSFIKRLPRRRTLGAGMVAVGVVLGSAVWLNPRTIYAHPHRPTFALISGGVATADSTLNPLRRELASAVAAQIVAIGRIDLRRLTDTSMARDAGADHLVDAIVEQTGDRVTVRASIRSALDGHEEASLDAISVPYAAVQTIVPIVTARIGGAVAALTDTLYGAWALAGSRTPTYAAYQAFSLALESIANYNPARSVMPIVEQLATASRLDSTFAAARVLLIEQSDLSPRMRALSDSVQAVALGQRHALGAYDAAALDNIVAIRRGDWEAAMTAARRMVSVAPNLPDAHFAAARAQMATRRYEGALASLEAIAGKPAWFTPRPELWQWELVALHALGEYETGVEHFARLTAQHPDDEDLCWWGIPDLVALARETAVDALVSQCASMVGRSGSTNGPAKIPNRGYFSHVVPHYLAHGNRAAAIRAAARVRPGFEKYAGSEPAKARDLATMDCMLGEWAACYPPLAKWARKAGEMNVSTRRLGVAAAHVGDSSGVRAALLAIDSAAAGLPRGHALVSRAMIHAAAGRRDSAIYLIGRAIHAGVTPTGTEWLPWQGTPDDPVAGRHDWYHAYELLSLRDDPVFAANLRPREE